MNHQAGKEKSVDSEKSTSALPPRSDFHKDKKKKTRFKIKYPIIRLLALLFILLPVAILSYKFNVNPNQLVTNKSANFESISYVNEADLSPKSKDREESPAEEPETIEQVSIVTQEGQIQPEVEKQEKVAHIDETDQKVVEYNSKTTNEEAKQPVKEESKDRYDIKYHKVGADETLYRISMKYYNSRSGEELIKSWNHLNGDTVIEGQVLQIPIKINE